jgi:beta-propeller repeat-containing protein/Big-like domain-containing protein
MGGAVHSRIAAMLFIALVAVAASEARAIGSDAIAALKPPSHARAIASRAEFESVEARAIDARTRSAGAEARAIADYGRLPLLFERADPDAEGRERFVGRSAGYAFEVSAQGVRVAAPPAGSTPRSGRSALTLEFDGADPAARVDGLDPHPTRIHRFRAGSAEVDISAYGRVRVARAYPHVDIVFHGHGRELEYDIVVEPGGEPAAIALRAAAGTTLSLDPGGDLRATADGASVVLRRPFAYQLVAGRRVEVESAFVVDERGNARIAVAAYDAAHVLVVDPVVSYATYLGGTSYEQGTAIAVDSAGNAYVAGYTHSTDFPLVSAYDRSLGRNGDVDVFVSKLNAAGTALVWSTYLGGASSVDWAIAIAVDQAGSAYVTGRAGSDNFPVSATAWQKPIAGGGTFVVKLGTAGNTLAYSTYVAGATASAIAVDRNGSAYVAGAATAGLSTTPGALQAVSRASGTTGFVLKLNAAGSAPDYSTFIGGSGSEEAVAVAIDASGNAHVAGWTTSGDFPTINAFQAAPRGQKDGFVTKLDASGGRLLYSTRLGGALDDAVNAIAVDAGGNAYVAGETYSADFPSQGGFQPVKAGARLVNSSTGSAFVAKLAPGGDALVWSSFLGGEVCTTLCQIIVNPQPQYKADAAFGLAVDSSGHVYVTGIARSYTFPLVDTNASPKRTDNQASAFVTLVGQSGNRILWSTFLRTGSDYSDSASMLRLPTGAATGVAVDPSGAAYVTGDGDSESGFQPTPGAFQSSNVNNQGAVVVKFAATPALTLASSNANVDAQTPVTLTATLPGAAVTGDVTFMDGTGWLGTAPLVANRATLVTTLPIGIHALNALLRVPGLTADTPLVYQVVDAPLACTP